MTVKRALIIIVAACIAGAYLAGYWPEHRRLTEARAAAGAAQARLSAAEAQLRLGEILGLLLRVSDAVDARNYGEAATMSSVYFDRVRAEAARQEQADVKQSLDELLGSRDRITTTLARSDASVSVALREQELTLRAVLGYQAIQVPTSGANSK